METSTQKFTTQYMISIITKFSAGTGTENVGLVRNYQLVPELVQYDDDKGVNNFMDSRYFRLFFELYVTKRSC